MRDTKACIVMALLRIITWVGRQNRCANNYDTRQTEINSVIELDRGERDYLWWDFRWFHEICGLGHKGNIRWGPIKNTLGRHYYITGAWKSRVFPASLPDTLNTAGICIINELPRWFYCKRTAKCTLRLINGIWQKIE